MSGCSAAFSITVEPVKNVHQPGDNRLDPAPRVEVERGVSREVAVACEYLGKLLTNGAQQGRIGLDGYGAECVAHVRRSIGMTRRPINNSPSL
jgi:hypothetical protein